MAINRLINAINNKSYDELTENYQWAENVFRNWFMPVINKKRTRLANESRQMQHNPAGWDSECWVQGCRGGSRNQEVGRVQGWESNVEGLLNIIFGELILFSAN